MSTEAAQEPKKKRRQNVACDPCKLRRVKCDLLELLSSAGGAGPSTSTPAQDEEPLHLLVRRNPGVSCTNCRNKSVQCSTEGILNPIRPNKGGRRIEEARRKFGAGELLQVMPTARNDSVLQDENYRADVEQHGLDFWTDPGPSSSQADTGTIGGASHSMASHTWQQPLPQGCGPQVSGTEPPDQLLSAILANIDQQLFPGISRPTPYTPPIPDEPTPLSASTPDMQNQALRKWEELSVNTAQTIANRSLRSTPLPSATPTEQVADLNGHTSHLDTLVPALGKLDIETNTFLPILPVHGSDVGTNEQTRPGSSGPSPPNHMVRHRDQHSTSYSSAVTSAYSSKRLRSEDSDTAGSSPAISPNMATLNEKDPWHIWQQPDEHGQSVIAWSRKDQVQESLADKALGIELSRHLVTVYFQAVHYSLPVLSPESFYLEWEACGRRSDRMNPAQEALCAVIEAWAARYSDNPAILGLPYQKAHTAPKVIMTDGQFAPGTQARAHWGKARLPVCNALLDRAGRIIDANSIMRRPSVTGLQALSLYNQLMHMSDQGSRVKDQWIQNMMVHATILEQMKLLQMFWTAGDPILTGDDSSLNALQVRMKQRRLFWTTAVADSCWAAATGMPPKMPEEELAAGRAWVDEVIDSLPNSTMKVLAFFMKIWHRLAMVGRSVSSRVTKYNDRKGNIAVAEFTAAVQWCWSEIRSIMTELNESAVSLLGACEAGVLGFSPLNYITNMRLCCPFYLLVLHEAIRNHLAFRQNLFGSYVAEPESEIQAASQHGQDLAQLNKLHLQSVDVLLYNCRSQMALFKSLLPTGIIQSASIMIRVLIASGQFLAEVPTNEQGYPANTLGGYDWTWEEKQKLVNICTDALYQIGWAWSDITSVLESIHLAMERMTPSPDEIAVHKFAPPAVDVGIQVRRSRDLRIEDQGIQSALKFWPPKSIPDIISLSQSGGFADTPLIPQGVPGSDLGHFLHNRHSVHASSTGRTTPSGSQTPASSLAPSTMDVPGFSWIAQETETTDGQSGAKRLRLDQNQIPPSNFALGEAVRPTYNGDAAVWSQPNAGSAQVEANTASGVEDTSLWDLINGDGQTEDGDFQAFLQSLEA